MKISYFFVLLLLLFILPLTLLSDTYKTIKVEKGDTLWGISQKLYNDPFKWYILSEINNIENPNKIMPAMEIKVPADIETYLKERVERQLLAEGQISAITDTTVADTPSGLIGTLSDLKIELPSFKEISQQTDTEISAPKSLPSPYKERPAIINYIRGDVNFKHHRQNIWVSLIQSGVPCVKEDMISTEGNSIAMISFDDGSYIRLMPNTILKFQESYFDSIENSLNTVIHVMEGNIEAHIRDAAPLKANFIFVNNEISAEGVGKFYIRANKSNDFIAELYEGYLTVSSKGKSVELRNNSGIYVAAGEAPVQTFDLLVPPKQISPPDQVYARSAVPLFEWTKVEKAVQYKIQIAKDPIFNLMILEDNYIVESEYRPQALLDGKYYWRIAAIDINGITGIWSDIRIFEIDTIAPRLIVTSPLENEIISERIVKFKGITEPGQPITINQFTHYPDAKGHFEIDMHLNKGTNVVLLSSKDRAGNKTEIYRIFHLDPYKETEIINDRIFSTTGDWAVNVFNAQGQVILNDRFYEISYGEFQQDLKFLSGPNHLILTLDDIGYKDIVFNYAVNEPIIKQIRISPVLKDNQAYLNIFVKAEETDAPLSKTAELVIEEYANISNRYPVMLHYSDALNEYQGTIAVHPNVLKKELSIGSIKITDIIGNTVYKSSGSFDKPHEVSDFWAKARSQYSAFKIQKGVPVFLLSAAGILLML